MSGSINSLPLTFLNVYGPNSDDPNFYKKVFDLLPDANNSNIIIGGDLNCYLDPYLDRLSTRPPPRILSVQVLNNLLKCRNLVEIWRIQHATDRDYSYYSHVHKSYSRIDYFLVDSQLISRVIETKYHSILISDHSPLIMAFDLSLPKQSGSTFVDYATIKLEEFLEFNDN